jgi:hypothetical protein
MAADRIVDRERSAAIRHVQPIHRGLHLEQLGGDVLRRALAG